MENDLEYINESIMFHVKHYLISGVLAGIPAFRGYLAGLAPVLRIITICRADSSTGKLNDSTLSSWARSSFKLYFASS